MDIKREEKKEILQSLGKLGIGYLKAKELVETHGYKRIAEVTEHGQDHKFTNPAGYVICTLEEQGAFWSKVDYRWNDGKIYITGKYAAFTQH